MPIRTLFAVSLALLSAVLLAALSPLGGAPAPLGSAKKVTNSIGMQLVLIPRGKFLMGSPPGEANRSSNEGPQHEVELPRSFYLGTFEVTQAQYRKVVGTSPSYFSPTGAGREAVKALDTADFAVESVPWKDAVAFCAKLSALPGEKTAGRTYRLPTEAEWEHACRAGGQTAFNVGAMLSAKDANIGGSIGRPVKVGSYKPNAWGLYDMHGNVWEWTADWYDANYYARSPRKAPRGPDTGSFVVARGGGWNMGESGCRSAYRGWTGPSGGSHIGFRVACTTPGTR